VSIFYCALGGGGLLIVESGNGLIRIVMYNVGFDIVWV